MKVDIEGADRFCILPLTRDTRPALHFLRDRPDVEELWSTSVRSDTRASRSSTRFALRELANEANLRDRAVLRVAERLAWATAPASPRRPLLRRGPLLGPVPWKTDGRWYSGKKPSRAGATARRQRR
jgi:hypothetical protein